MQLKDFVFTLLMEGCTLKKIPDSKRIKVQKKINGSIKYFEIIPHWNGEKGWHIGQVNESKNWIYFPIKIEKFEIC